MKPETKPIQRDELEEMKGGYAPNEGTPTHFFGREATQKIIEGNKPKRKRMPKRAKKQAKTKIVHEKVAPGMTIAYEVPVKKGYQHGQFSINDFQTGDQVYVWDEFENKERGPMTIYFHEDEERSPENIPMESEDGQTTGYGLEDIVRVARKRKKTSE